MVAVLLLTVAIKLGAQQTGDEMNSGVLYGNNWACTIQAPNGWILDNQSLVKYAVYAIFFPKGMSLRENNKNMPIIYFKSAKLKSESDEELKAFVVYDLSNILQSAKSKRYIQMYIIATILNILKVDNLKL